MSKERYNQIIDEVYENYKSKTEIMMGHGFHGTLLSQEDFISKIKTDSEFSETWGLKIEERELSLEERRKLAKYDSEFVSPMTVESWDRNNIPTKLITLTYNNETIESYE